MELGLAYVDLCLNSISFIKDLNVTDLYHSVRWCNVQPRSETEYSWATYDFEFQLEREYGLSSVRSISHTPQWAIDTKNDYPHWTNPPDINHWINFITQLITRYPGRTWTIWAEPDNYPPRESKDLVCFTGTSEQYGEMLKTAYEIAKKIDPTCSIGMGGLVGATINGSFEYDVFAGQTEDRLVFLEDLAHKGYLKYCDFIGADSYAYGYGGIQNIKNGLSRIRKISRRKTIWILETGCKLTRTDKIDPILFKKKFGHETVTQETSAGLLFSMCKICEEFEIPKMFWVKLQDSDWGLVNRIGKKHLSYYMFKYLSLFPEYRLSRD